MNIANRIGQKKYFSMPPNGKNLRIGLMGGSFNPPHKGHLEVAQAVRRRAGLNAIWWLVSPGNPLKSHDNLPGINKRIRSIENITSNPHHIISGIETALGSNNTITAIKKIQSRSPCQFFWIMGSDNLRQFHQWHKWNDIINALPIIVVTRPGSTNAMLSSVSVKRYQKNRKPLHKLTAQKKHQVPSLFFLTYPRINLSSTSIRQSYCIGTGDQLGSEA